MEVLLLSQLLLSSKLPALCKPQKEIFVKPLPKKALAGLCEMSNLAQDAPRGTQHTEQELRCTNVPG